MRCELTLSWWPCLFCFYRPTLFSFFVTCWVIFLFVLVWFFGNLFSSTNGYITGFGPTFSTHGPYSLCIFCWDQYSDVTCGATGLWKQIERGVSQELKERKSPNLIKIPWELSPSLWSCCSSFFGFYSFRKEFVAPRGMRSRWIQRWPLPLKVMITGIWEDMQRKGDSIPAFSLFTLCKHPLVLL